MSDVLIGAKIVVGSNANEAIGSLRKQLKDAQAEVAALSDKFGATSAQAVEAAKRAADLKDRIGDAKALTDAFNPDRKFQAFASALQGVVGGFTAVQGAMGLIGVESDQVEKTLLKVQSAMALSQGINSILEARDSFKNLSTVIQSTTVFQKANNLATIAATAVQRALGIATVQTSTAFKVLKGAIAATGIGLLVIGVSALISKISQWTSSTEDNKAAQDRLNRALEEQQILFARQKEDLARQRELANLRAKVAGQGADEIFKINQDFNQKDRDAATKNFNVLAGKVKEFEKTRLKIRKDGRLEGNEEDVKNYEDLKKQLDSARKEITEADFKNQTDILQNQIRINDEKDAASKKASDRAKQLAEQEADRQKQLREERLEAEKKADEDIRLSKQENYLATIKDDDERAKKKAEIDLKNRIREIDALNIDEKRKRELRLQAAIATQNEIDKITEEARKKQEEKENERLNKIAKNAVDSLEKTKASIAERQKAINEVLNTEEEKELNALTEQFAKRFQLIKGNEQAELALTEQFESQKAAIKKKYADQALATTASILGQAADLFGRQTAAGKTVAVAEATINTYLAASKALTGIVKGNPLSAALAIAQAGVIVATGLKNVREIVRTKVPGASSSSPVTSSTLSAAAPIAPPTPQAALTQLDQATINQLGSASNRSYVLESDITNSQERITRINRAARLN